MGLKGQVVPISIPFYASSSGPYGLPCFNQRQQQIPVESMKTTCSPVYSTPLRRLLTTNRRFLKLASFCPKVRFFWHQELSYFAPFFANSGYILWENRRFLKLSSFCPEVRPNSPLKLDSECWKNNTDARNCKSVFTAHSSASPLSLVSPYGIRTSRET